MNLDLNTSFISPEQLIMLGKSAAQVSETSGMSLTDAVVRSVGMTKLNSHQVRRVVEAANHEAFHRKFASMDPTMRVVELDGGPADPRGRDGAPRCCGGADEGSGVFRLPASATAPA